MSPRRGFPSFMTDNEIGRNLKLLRMTVPERWTYLAGILAIAAKSPDRGALLIAEGIAATASDVAAQASVPVRVAKSTLARAREMGMLYVEDGVERVHDFEEMNPAPKRDETNAERQARYRARRNAERNAVSNGPVTAGNAPEVEGEEEGNNSSTDSGLTSEVFERDLLAGDPGPEEGSNVFDFRDGKTGDQERGVA